jgi:DNA-directed RNA polymerase I, II, and III subunit RPABC2
MGAPILIDSSKAPFKAIDIAMMELELKILPITIRRTLPEGSYQDIPLNWLLRT